MVAPGFNVTTNIGTTGVSWRQLDIVDQIYNLDPTDTPFFELTGTVPAKSREHAWQTRTLKARGLNAMFEGADYTFPLVSAPSRVVNTTQILEQGVEISNSLAQESAYAAPDIMRDQINLRMVEHRNDIEWNLINSTFLMNATDGAAKMRGLRACITTNTTNNLGVTLTESIFVTMLQTVWRGSGVVPDTVLTGEHGQNKINTFSAQGATKWIDTTDKSITNQVMMYNSSFASVQIMLCRDLTSVFNFTSGVEIIFFNRKWHHKAWLRPTFVKPVLVDVADAKRTIMISELTHQHDNEKSAAKWQGVA